MSLPGMNCQSREGLLHMKGGQLAGRAKSGTLLLVQVASSACILAKYKAVVAAGPSALSGNGTNYRPLHPWFEGTSFAMTVE